MTRPTHLAMNVDGSSARLIALTGALVLAGDEVPKASAKSLHGLSRAARGSLLALEPAVALDLLQRMTDLLAGQEGVYVDALTRKINDVTKAITWTPKESA